MVNTKALTNIFFAIITILLSIPIFAAPQNVNMYMFMNNTHDDLYSLSVGGYCTVADISFFPPSGGHGVHPDVFLKNCDNSRCDVAIHLTKDCSGPIIGSVFLDVSGVMSISTYVTNYTITYITVNPGPNESQEIYVKNYP